MKKRNRFRKDKLLVAVLLSSHNQLSRAGISVNDIDDFSYNYGIPVDATCETISNVFDFNGSDENVMSVTGGKTYSTNFINGGEETCLTDPVPFLYGYGG